MFFETNMQLGPLLTKIPTEPEPPDQEDFHGSKVRDLAGTLLVVGIAKENAAAAAAAICDSSTIGWVSALSSAGASGSGLKPARSGFDTCKCGKKKTMSTPTAIHGHNSEKW